MVGWVKNVLIMMVIFGIIVFSAFMVQQQNSNTRASVEVEGAIESALLGESRLLGRDGGMDKRELVANVVESVVETQKKHGKTVRLEYMFLDVNGERTEVDKDIDSVQFSTTIVGEKGENQSRATKRISLNMIEKRNALGQGDNMRVVLFESSTDQNRSRTITIPGLKGVTGIEVDNGNTPTYSISGSDITVNVSGGEGKKVHTGEGDYVREHTKWVDRQLEPEYDKDGYVGTLEEYTLTGKEHEEDTIWVEEYPKADYDEDGYVGTLEEYEAYGEFIEGDRKYVEGQLIADYDIDGFSGKLSEYLAWMDIIPEDTVEVENHPTAEYKDEEGYVGTLDENEDGSYSGKVTRPEYEQPVYRYRGWVSEEDLDSRVYLYRGYVTRPALDQRETAYRGWVTREESDSREEVTVYTYEVRIYYQD